MRAAKERPPAKPPWSTPTSTAHPLHPHPHNHTPTITTNQENQTKRLTLTAPPPNLHCLIQPQASKLLRYKSMYAHPSELQQQTQANTSHPIITFWHLLLVLLDLHATLYCFNYVLIKLLYFAAVLQSGQEEGSALVPNTARLPTE
eukprot:1882352-Ditylum_brightwellii.AAC.1